MTIVPLPADVRAAEVGHAVRAFAERDLDLPASRWRVARYELDRVRSPGEADVDVLVPTTTRAGPAASAREVVPLISTIIANAILP